MRRLLEFLYKYNYWFLFIALEVASFVLLFRYNGYHQSVFLSSANGVAGWIYSWQGEVTQYLHLQEENKSLMRRNAELERKAMYYETLYKQQNADSVDYESLADLDQTVYSSVSARVVSNSLDRPNNYITINRGLDDGVGPDMGVVDASGVVGIVYKATSHYALVISLLNGNSNLSCKVLGTDYFGYLKWEEADPEFATLKDLPRHAEFSLGDTIVTSGYSTVFPEGILVGTVDDMADSNDGLSYQLKVKLVSNFATLTYVRVLGRPGKEELLQLNSEAK